MRRLVAVGVVACAAMVGCGGGSSAGDVTQPVVTTAVPADVEARARVMAWPTGQHLVRSREEWVSLWSTNKGQPNINCVYNPSPACLPLPALPMPEFDFGQYSLLVVFERLDFGRTLRWGSVEVSGGGLRVEVKRDSSPAEYTNYIDTSQCVIFLLIPATSLPVRFIWSYV